MGFRNVRIYQAVLRRQVGMMRTGITSTYLPGRSPIGGGVLTAVLLAEGRAVNVKGTLLSRCDSILEGVGAQGAGTSMMIDCTGFGSV